MFTIDEAQAMIEQMVQELPEKIFQELNGGVLILPNIKYSPEARCNDLYIMGEYTTSPTMGRLVRIYFGSIQAVLGENASAELWEDKLRTILYHELTHHLENLAGERDLEIEDAININRYHNHLPMNFSIDEEKKSKQKKQ